MCSGKTSRLYKRLVYDEQIATDVNAGADLREIAGQFVVTATAKPGGNLSQIERAIDEELERFLASGPTARELKRVKAQAAAAFIRGLERIGGFGGKSDVLAMNQVFTGDPDYYKARMKAISEATVRQVQDCARRWLGDGQFVLEIEPFPPWSNNNEGVDRSNLPVPDLRPEPRFPAIERTQLSNGLKIVFAARQAIPVVQLTLLVDAGFAADQGGIPGTARLAMDMLDDGTRTRSALEISEALDVIGARLSTGADPDTAYVSLNTLKDFLDEALEIYADVIMNPVFPVGEFQRLQKQLIAAVQREKSQPNAMALRVLPRLLYGPGHAYANPFSGLGSEDSLRNLTADRLQQFHSTWFKPNHSTLVVVGDCSLGEITSRLERLFRGWQPGQIPSKNIAAPPAREKPAIYLLDRPGSQQSVIFAANVAPPKSNPDETAIELANKILGGDFTSRINMNLREEKHWTYGARSSIPDARGARPFFVVAPVQSDKTREAIVEIERELSGILSDRPVTKAELEKAITNQTLRLAGTWETMSRVAGALSEFVRFGLPDDYYQTYADRVRSQTIGSLSQGAAKVISPNHTIWVVVGDRAKVEPAIRALNFGEVQLIDTEGRTISQ